MPTVDARGLQTQLKNGTIQRMYYFYGSDILQVENSVKKLLKHVTGSDASDGITKFDGADLDLSQLADEAELCPMFADYNCILIHDCNMETMREDARKTLRKILEDIPDCTVLIFYVTGFDIYGGKTGKNKKPTAKNKTIIDYIAKHGTVCCLEPKTPAAMAGDIVVSVKKRGCDITQSTAQLLAEECGCQTLMIQQELEKLCAFADGGEITAEMIHEMVTPRLETTVYALTKAVIRRRSADAMRAVDELLAMRVEMPYLMATVSGCFIDLQRAVTARQNRRTVQDVMNDFSYRFEFAVENAFRDSMNESPEHIARCLKLLRDAETTLHTQAVNERVLFERTIVEMLRQ